MRCLAPASLLFLAACSPALDGDWQAVGEDNVITFGPNGDFKQVSYGTTYTGTWKRLKDDEIEVRFSGESVRLGTLVLKIRFKDGVLHTANPAGRQQQWKRP